MQRIAKAGVVLLLVMIFPVATTFGLPEWLVTVPCTKCAEVQFVPEWGAVEIGETTWDRYVYHYMYWPNKDRLAWFWKTTDSTLEVETRFYNYNYDSYWGQPTGYWESDLPTPYLDTPSFDIP